MDALVEKSPKWKPTRLGGYQAVTEDGLVTIFNIKQPGLERYGLIHADSYSRDWYDSTEAAMLAFEASTVRWINPDAGNGWKEHYGQHKKQTRLNSKYSVGIGGDIFYTVRKEDRLDLNCVAMFDNLNQAKNFVNALDTLTPSDPQPQTVCG